MLGDHIKNSFWIVKLLVNLNVLVVSAHSHFNAFSDVAHFLPNTRANFNYELKLLCLKSIMELWTEVARDRLFYKLFPQISKGYFYKCASVQTHSIRPLWHCQYSESQERHGTEGLRLPSESEVFLATAEHHMNETKRQVHQESSFSQDNAVLSRLT